MITTKFESVRGDTYSRDFSIKKSNWNKPIDEIYFTLKASETDKNIVMQKKLSLDNGITLMEKADDGTYYYNITIGATETDDFKVDKDYYFDIQILIGAIKKTIIKGMFVVSYDITRTRDEK